MPGVKGTPLAPRAALGLKPKCGGEKSSQTYRPASSRKSSVSTSGTLSRRAML